MKSLLRLLAISCFAHSPAWAQVERGTIVVAYSTPDKIVMAADSRVTLGWAKGPSSDKECKITAIRGQVIFSSANVASYRGSNVVQPWKNSDEARSAYKNACGPYPSRCPVKEVARAWTLAVLAHIESLYRANPDYAKSLTDNGVFTVALFGGRDEAGSLELIQVLIGVDQTGVHPDWGKAICPHNYCKLGKVEIVTEFTDLTSQRAKEEAKNWTASPPHNPADADLLKAIRLVDLTIAYHQGTPDVGGKIDAVQLSKDGTLNCLVPQVRARPLDVQSHNTVLRALTWVSPYSEGRQAWIALRQHDRPPRRTFHFPSWELAPRPVHFPLDPLPAFEIL